MSGLLLLRAPYLLTDPWTLVRDGALLVRGERILELACGAAAAARLARRHEASAVDLPGLATAGLVNAHAHLELGAIGLQPSRGGFGAWIERVLRARESAEAADLERGASAGADELLASGTTAVGDVDTTGAAARALVGHALPALVYREALDAQDPGRTASAVAALERPLRPAPELGEGLSPHAPFTVSPALLSRLAELALRKGRPVTTHWSETAAEVDYMLHGAGPLADLLGPSPRRSGLEVLADAGLLRSGTSLVHGNHPRSGEPERIARAGVVLVHCPGSHAHFERPPFCLELYRRAGVRLAVGTDSRASNAALDMPRELALLRRAHPELEPDEVWEIGTLGGAAALGREGSIGRLAAGHRADLCVWDQAAAGREDALAELVGSRPRLLEVWTGGERRDPRRPPRAAGT